MTAAAKMTKKHRFFKPAILLVLGVVLCAVNIGKHIMGNGKKYVSVGLVLLFFLMSSSFATPDQVKEEEIYLSNTGEITIYDDAVSLFPSDYVIEENDNDLAENVEFSAVETLSDEEEKELESTENVDKFTLDDFYTLNALVGDSDGVDSEISGFDKTQWYLLLVNKTHPVPDDYEVKLTSLSGSMKCDERVLEPLCEMLNAASSEGVNLFVCSPYRDQKRQEMLFLRRINAYMEAGKSYLEAYKKASRDVIVPGCSEHQLGIAFDIVADYHTTLDYEFGDTKAGLWLKEHCAEYGFILRYPKGKENITGIVYEPWHFRYVGVEAATYIMENEITLEEFIEDL